MSVATDASVLSGVTAELDRLRDLDEGELTAGELAAAVLEAQRARAALEALEARVLARWDATKEWQADDAKSGSAWLAWQERIPMGVARQRLRHARALRNLPEVAKAWADGEIDRSHITTMLGVCTPRTAQAFLRDHGLLLDSARCEGFVDFKRRCDRWAAIVDPDGAEQGAEAKRSARAVHLNQTPDEMWFGRMVLDPVSGAIVHGTLQIIEKELFRADWEEAKARLGRTPLVTELGRTPAQRRADALVEMATRARNAPLDGRRPAPLISVVVGLESFTGPIIELFNRTVLAPSDIVRLLPDSYIERIVFDSPSRVVDVGQQRRFFSDAQRRAIMVRDRTCFHPSCDEEPLYPHIDHIEEHHKGGPTTMSNGRLGCSWHNLRRNRHGPQPDECFPNPGDPTADPDPP